MCCSTVTVPVLRLDSSFGDVVDLFPDLDHRPAEPKQNNKTTKQRRDMSEIARAFWKYGIVCSRIECYSTSTEACSAREYNSPCYIEIDIEMTNNRGEKRFRFRQLVKKTKVHMDINEARRGGGVLVSCMAVVVGL